MSLADTEQRWQNACLALDLVQADRSLPGLIVRARAGPVRDCFMARLTLSHRRVHSGVTAEALLGGIDVAATLSSGQIIETTGLLQSGACLVVAMAERMPPQTAALLAQALDEQKGIQLIMLDEGSDDDEAVPDCLKERVPFWVDLSDLRHSDLPSVPMHEPAENLPKPADAHFDQITAIAAHLGVNSARALGFAMQTAQLLARDEIESEHIATACALTFAHRATQVPDANDTPQDPPPPEQQETQGEDTSQSDQMDIPDEVLLDAVLANLPPDLLGSLSAKTQGKKGSGSGAKKKGNRRGRPLPAIAAPLSSDQKIDLYATLRAAAPWQKIRRKMDSRDGPLIRASDIRVKRFEDKSDRLIVFAVDASGSSAISRLAEVKGAIELLLGEAYARRDHVALVAFRGREAEVLLPPTRSLVQTKRRLADLPGGGGTPLAFGMEAALEIAQHAERRGMSPCVCILTDGRANIDREGNANRKQAMADAEAMGAAFVTLGIDAIVIDSGNRPERQLQNLANVMQAPYLPMPRADATRLSRAIDAAI